MKEQLSIKLNIHLEVSTQKVVKIKAHKLIVNGKTVKVCPLYRVIYAPWSFCYHGAQCYQPRYEFSVDYKI
jgi:hypothetical protein